MAEKQKEARKSPKKQKVKEKPKKREASLAMKGKARIRNTKAFNPALVDPAVMKQKVNGLITMKLIGATNLANTDTIGVSDPYCIVRATFNDKIFAKTKTINNSLNPRWNETFEFDVKMNNAQGEFHINLFDSDTFKKDDWLGMVTIPLYNIVEAGPAGINTHLTLNLETHRKPKSATPGALVVHIFFKERTVNLPVSFSMLNLNEKIEQKKDKDKPHKEKKVEDIVVEETAVRQGCIVDKIEPEDHILSLYSFEKALGEGATAVVKLATINKEKKKVAIKIVDKKHEDWDEVAIECFRTEVEVMQRINSPLLLPAIALHETEKKFYIVMDLVPGGDLFEAIEESENGYLPADIAKKWIHNVASGLIYLHSKGICHRDIKPENILLTSRDHNEAQAKLVDYGASAFFTSKHPYMKTYTGTLCYMAPEIIQGIKYTKTVDIWSLGALSFVMLSGCFPFDGEDDAAVTSAILQADLQFDSEWNSISPLAQMFIASCLAAEPKDRVKLTTALENPWFK